MTKHEFLIIGSGPGGYIAAIRAAQLGYDVAIIEKENTLGGICLNWGCIPTKSLLQSASVYHNIKKAGIFGITVQDIKFDFNKIIERSRDVVTKLSNGISGLMKKNNIKVYYGTAKLLGNSTVEITDHSNKIINVTSTHIILATGSKARNIPGIDFDNKIVWNAKNAMTPDKFPKSLLIIGSGAIGIEFASFYNTFGTEVTIVELKDNILPLEDHEISECMHNILSNKGIKIHTKSSVTKLEKFNNYAKIQISDTIHLQVDKIILAAGVQPNSNDIGLENTQIKTDAAGFIITDQYCCTNELGVYAIGDVAGAPCLAHKASHEAVLCVENIAEKENKTTNKTHPINKNNIPSCIFSIPQIASVGLTENQARTQGYDIKVGKFNANCNGKAVAIDETEGFVKVIIDKSTGELLGAHMIGAEVTEMIHGYVTGKQIEATDQDIMSSIFPHPTLSEMIHEAVLSSNNGSLNS
ncbi:dihydrolipoyl dehydrogenase [Ehrlichia chaffeensis str. Heartland]|uniref:Dihydrolipoyl dehydrogenase n=1 Tax=Ehrlichia chaffeensis (strain ATCC CRL-10679 / Arkansas) TaxID=205920 RepID=Q2GFK4_EHRCR|nr:dihydrolipoyl dehydrogenase [Ehrlichia chaffeensis]ABD45349.1 dihydrolipoamide dehydrogenase [Ehrlichia chaffeensis str. Arkansas]AHX04009.1 dihydrolipoyl dehydrogenase [Ehrlichia chaffeensis str. Heartland]AHX05257.1 dihydrolipoyl dehydrogenase [Ehrlichia chaffeensis str. Jax]AHX06245.1 dihydrolipoyl dehydrogenase [Ehrlichia chaffeensis str. Liberty]AHX07214.1 dihydrolipoyl dehydrogenase [Ehrlichia chaffeensis str. Osceola]